MRIILTSCIFILFYSCASRKLTTTWKGEPTFSDGYQRILVVAILPEADSLLRATIETESVHSLKNIGYNAFSAISTFGPKGLAEPAEEATYLKLCNSGTDAVMILALVPQAKKDHYPGIGPYVRSNNYYYNRIWDYQKMQADILNNSSPEDEYFWESIFFDLSTLQATSTIRTRSFKKSSQEKITNDLVKLVIKKMMKENILTKRHAGLKAF